MMYERCNNLYKQNIFWPIFPDFKVNVPDYNQNNGKDEGKLIMNPYNKHIWIDTYDLIIQAKVTKYYTTY